MSSGRMSYILSILWKQGEYFYCGSWISYHKIFTECNNVYQSFPDHDCKIWRDQEISVAPVIVDVVKTVTSQQSHTSDSGGRSALAVSPEIRFTYRSSWKCPETSCISSRTDSLQPSKCLVRSSHNGSHSQLVFSREWLMIYHGRRIFCGQIRLVYIWIGQSTHRIVTFGLRIICGCAINFPYIFRSWLSGGNLLRHSSLCLFSLRK